MSLISRAWILGLIFTSFVSSSAFAQLFYAPEKLNAATASLIVVVHGCLQNAESMALGTGFNRVADQKNWVVLYPQVPAGSNSINCWEWYKPENQNPTSGQLRLIMDQIQALRLLLGLKNPKQYAVGISSGGATVAGLAACFPDQFAAVALHSAPAYGTAQSLAEADKVLRDGPSGTTNVRLPCTASNYQGRLLVLHGEKDNVVNPKHAERAFADLVGADKNRGEVVMIKDLDHAWSGFHPKLKTEIPFFSPVGPSATDLITQFF